MLFPLAVLIATLAVFSNTLVNGFVWNDNILIVPNEIYRSHNLLSVFRTPANGLDYQPLRDITYISDHLLWGFSPFGFHLSNLLLYAATVLLAYILSSRIFARRGVADPDRSAFWCALVFSLHPLHAEAVNYISARDTLLAAFFTLLSWNLLLMHEEKGGRRLYLLALASFVFALFSRVAVAFFPLLLLLEALLAGNRTPSLRAAFVRTGPFFAAACLAGALHFGTAAQTVVMQPDSLWFGSHSLLIQACAVVQFPFFYAFHFFSPFRLSAEYTVQFLPDWKAAASVAALAGIGAAIILLRRRYPVVVTGLLWYMTSMLPVENLFTTHPMVADRHAFLSLLGLALIAGYVASQAERANNTLRVAMASALIILAAACVARNADWKDDISLWESANRIDPSAGLSRLADAYWKNGDHLRALALSERSEAVNASFHYSLYRGRYRLLLGDPAGAVPFLQTAMERGGHVCRDTPLALGQALEMMGDMEKALSAYGKAVDARPFDLLDARRRQAEEGMRRAQWALAPRLAPFRAAVARDPVNPDARFALALQLDRLLLYEDAMEEYRSALAIKPDLWQAHHNLGIIYERREALDLAVQQYRAAIGINPQDIEAINNMGTCHMRMRATRNALQAFESALALQPTFYRAAYNIGKYYFQEGDRAQAKEYLLRARAYAPPEHAFMIDQYLRKL